MPSLTVLKLKNNNKIKANLLCRTISKQTGVFIKTISGDQKSLINQDRILNVSVNFAMIKSKPLPVPLDTPTEPTN